MRVKNKLIWSVLIIVILLVACVGLIGFFTTKPIYNRVFTDISDFNRLDQYAVKEIDVSDDKNLNGLAPKSSYVKEISYNGDVYSVYAYVFSDTESAISYFQKCTGKNTDSVFQCRQTTCFILIMWHIMEIVYTVFMAAVIKHLHRR